MAETNQEPKAKSSRRHGAYSYAYSGRPSDFSIKMLGSVL